jgi:hypothetical protein
MVVSNTYNYLHSDCNINIYEQLVSRLIRTLFNDAVLNAIINYHRVYKIEGWANAANFTDNFASQRNKSIAFYLMN